MVCMGSMQVEHLLVGHGDVPQALLNCFASSHDPFQAHSAATLRSADRWLLSQRFSQVLVAIGAGQNPATTLKMFNMCLSNRSKYDMFTALNFSIMCLLAKGLGSNLVSPQSSWDLVLTQSIISPSISNQMAQDFMQTPAQITNPLHALRRAQVVALGGPPLLLIWVFNSILGTTLGTNDEEEFAQAMLGWMCDRTKEELALVQMFDLIEHLMALYGDAQRTGQQFSMERKTMNCVLNAIADAALTPKTRLF
eukprot:scaffold41321_cov45-Prasinocladus_malaysianus.AAC.1